MVSSKTFTAYLSVYELANYSSAKTFDIFSLDFWIVPYSSKGSEIANSTSIFLDWFSQLLNRDLDSS